MKQEDEDAPFPVMSPAELDLRLNRLSRILTEDQRQALMRLLQPIVAKLRYRQAQSALEEADADSVQT